MKNTGRWVLRALTGGVAVVVAACASMPGGGGGGSGAVGPMSFFVTSAGSGKGADLGGLAGADQICQNLGAAAGAGGKTWRAYLSTQGKDGAATVNARDRIGIGPWYCQKG